jgi:hypothetical protein
LHLETINSKKKVGFISYLMYDPGSGMKKFSGPELDPGSVMKKRSDPEPDLG